MATKVVIAVFAVWMAWLGYQYFEKSGTAYAILNRKIQDLDATSLNLLLEKVGRGYEYQVEEVRGKKYHVRWAINRPLFSDGTVDFSAIEARGRVDFIDLLPFGLFGLRVGSPFRYIITMKSSE